MNLFRHAARATLVAAAVALSACTPFTRVSGDSSMLGKLDGNWTVKYVASKELQGVSPAPELVFDTAKGTVTGFDGCNRLNGTFTFDGGRLKEKTATTRMACPNDAAHPASAAVADLLGNGAEVVEVALGQGRVLLVKNASSEIRLVPSALAK